MGLLSDVDWVTTRAGCTGSDVFLKIKEEVRRDVEIRNGLRLPNPHYGFKFQDDGESFTVVIEWSQKPQWVTFRFRGDTLRAIDHTGKEIAEAKVTMSRAGNCAIALPQDTERTAETWEFRFKALERLFFVAPTEF